MNSFLLKLAAVKEIVKRSSEIHREYQVAYQQAHKDLFELLANPSELEKENPYSKWMEQYFELEGQFFSGTPQNAKLGSDLETAVKSVIKSNFPKLVPPGFVELKYQHSYSLGRMEIALETNDRTTFIQVKRGFDTPTWDRIKEEKDAIENEKEGNRYLLISPTEYTNEDIRKEIKEKHLEKWCFIWKEKCWKGDRHDDWMERFLSSIF